MRDRKGEGGGGERGIPSSRRKIRAPLCSEKNSLSNFVDFLKSRKRPIAERGRGVGGFLSTTDRDVLACPRCLEN